MFNQIVDCLEFQKSLEFCKERGGSLVDESNPALQGFLSWELWRRHKVRFHVCRLRMNEKLGLI